MAILGLTQPACAPNFKLVVIIVLNIAILCLATSHHRHRLISSFLFSRHTSLLTLCPPSTSDSALYLVTLACRDKVLPWVEASPARPPSCPPAPQTRLLSRRRAPSHDRLTAHPLRSGHTSTGCLLAHSDACLARSKHPPLNSLASISQHHRLACHRRPPRETLCPPRMTHARAAPRPWSAAARVSPMTTDYVS